MINYTYYDQFNLMRKITCTPGKRVNVRCVNIRQHPRHIHDGCEILYIIKGSLNVQISYDFYTLQAGDFLIINPYEMHSIDAIKGEEENLAAVIQCSREIYTEKDGILVWQATIYNKENNFQKRIKEALEKIIVIYGEDSDFLNEKIEEKIQEMFVFFRNNYNLKIYNMADNEKNAFADNELLSQRLNQLMVYLYGNHTEPLTLEKIAADHGISKYYLSHIIKQAFGNSLQEMIGMIRADRSELYLLGTDYPMGYISDKVGFSSYQYFNKYFKACFHMSPGEYRKANISDTIAKKSYDEDVISPERAKKELLSGGREKKILITLELPEGNYDINIGSRIIKTGRDKTISVSMADMAEGIRISK